MGEQLERTLPAKACIEYRGFLCPEGFRYKKQSPMADSPGFSRRFSSIPQQHLHAVQPIPVSGFSRISFHFHLAESTLAQLFNNKYYYFKYVVLMNIQMSRLFRQRPDTCLSSYSTVKLYEILI